MRLQLTLSLPDASQLDVVVDADPDATVGALGAELASAVGGPPAALRTSGRLLDDDELLAGSGLVDGSVVRFGDGPDLPERATSGWQLRVVAGPDAGVVQDLPIGQHAVGPAGVLPDDRAAHADADVVVSRAGVVLRDRGSRTVLDGDPVSGQRPVAPGQLIGIGSSRLVVVAARPSDAAVEAAESGTLAFVRPPRLLPAPREVRLTLPQRPTDRTRRRFALAAVIAPLVLGLILAVVSRQPLYLLFAVASPVMVLSNVLAERRAGVKDDRAALERYDADLATTTAELSAALRAETARRRTEHPDPAAVLLTATLPTRRLWERRRTDPDALVLRVGTGNLPAEVVLESGGVRQLQVVPDVPVLVPLREVGVLAVAGPPESLQGLLRWLVLQLAVHHAPRDLSLTLLSSPAGTDWSFVRWLPHARPGDPDGPVALVGNDPDTVAARVAELVALVKTRRELAWSAARLDAAHFPAHVLVVDGYRELRTTPGLAGLLQDGSAVGVYAICSDEQDRFLPESAHATVLLDPADGVHLELRRTAQDPVTGVLGERVSAGLATAAARRLAPLRDIRSEDEAALPESVRLLDLLALEPPTVEGIRARWQPVGRSTPVVLGVGLDGPFRVDLRRDGPHALVAGTTGAGKSELLQSLIASLAVVHRPDALNFVLVDYKGGSAFKDCVALPHTVGLVTDLDAHLVERALRSLGAELRAREQQLAAAGVKDLEDYVELRVREAHRPPLPRLLIVIDEFASLVRELPTFVQGLVDIAQRGRSLGVHLVLATQRPSGVVSPEIRANTNLRLCLRVTDAADSTDVLETPDAARIAKSAPGRGFARLGHGALVPFQVGRIGGRRPGSRARSVRPPLVVPVGWRQLGSAAPRAISPDLPADREETDLSVLVAAIRAAGEAEGLPAQRSPWLPALPERVLLTDLDPIVTVGELPLGLLDLPALQQRRTASFDPAHDGHLLVVGSPGSGRSQLLRTLAGSVARGCSTADQHLYGLDCGGGALLALEGLPHCGAVVSRNQPERAVRLLLRLQAELERRQALLAGCGHADISEQRQAAFPADRLPHLLLLLDRWEGFTAAFGELDGGRLPDILLGILREGASLGVHLVLTGDRSLATSRIASLTDNRLVLRLNDRADYSLAGLPRRVPDDLPPGRGFWTQNGTELQIALLAGEDSGQGQAAALTELGEAAKLRDAGVRREQRPFRVDVLPVRITVEQAAALLPVDASPLLAVVGVGGDELQALGPDLAAGGSFLVAGPTRSGRSTALLAMARSLIARGTTVVVAAPRPSPLRELAGQTGVAAVVTDLAVPEQWWRALLDEAGPEPVVLLLDDAELLRDCPAAAVFEDVVKGALGAHRVLVLAGNADGLCLGLSGWQVEAKKARRGLLLSPQGGSDGDLIGVRLPRSAVGQPVQPGRGLLHLGDSRILTVAVPVP